MEIHLRRSCEGGEVSQQKEKFPTETEGNPLTDRSVGSFDPQRATCSQEKKITGTITHEYVPNCNCQQTSNPEAQVHHQRAGAGQEAQAASSVLRVKTGGLNALRTI